MANVTTPTDAQLAKIVNGDAYLVVALRRLFEQVGTTAPDQLQSTLIDAGNALAAANKNEATLAAIQTLVEMASLEAKEEFVAEDDLTPIVDVPHLDTTAIELVVLAPV